MKKQIYIKNTTLFRKKTEKTSMYHNFLLTLGVISKNRQREIQNIITPHISHAVYGHGAENLSGFSRH